MTSREIVICNENPLGITAVSGAGVVWAAAAASLLAWQLELHLASRTLLLSASALGFHPGKCR
jgi:hypothetical protein